MHNIEPEWKSLIRFCKENPNCMFEKLDIRNGKPKFWSTRQQVAEKTFVVIKHWP